MIFVAVKGRGMNVVCFLLGSFPASEFYMPTFRNTLFHLQKPMKMEQTEYSETSAYKIQTLRNYREESRQHSEHDESLKSRGVKPTAVVSLLLMLSLCIAVRTHFCKPAFHGDALNVEPISLMLYGIYVPIVRNVAYPLPALSFCPGGKS